MKNVWVVCESNKAGGDSDIWVFKNKKDAIIFWRELDVSDCWGEIFVAKKAIITKIEKGR